VNAGAGLDSGLLAFLQASQPRVIKLLDPGQGADAQIRAVVPDVFIVGRVYLTNQPSSGDPVAAAQAWFGLVASSISGNPTVDVWEGYNEPGVGSLDEMTWYTQFEVARVQLLASKGVNASIGQFSTGTPDVTNATIVQAFYPAIAAAIKYGGVLALHEYDSPYLWQCFSNATIDGWMMGRYRKLYNQFLIPAGLHIPLVITETGIDNSPCNSPDLGGWQAYCSYWTSAGWGNDCAHDYVSQLAWYDSLLRADDYVMGCTIFCYHCDGFGSYEVEPALPELQAYMNSV
jgi:hypothetical protein